MMRGQVGVIYMLCFHDWYEPYPGAPVPLA